MHAATKSAEVRRILERYLVEVVEKYDLCPWARSARTNAEVAIEILFGNPSIASWIATARETLARPGMRVAMIVAPELALDSPAFHSIRNAVVAGVDGVGVADFHPRAALDLATPARLVPWLRRSPDPMLQLVPLALLDSVRAAPPDRARQAQILAAQAAPPRDAGKQIADANHATATAHHAAIEAALAAIAQDREQAYARAGISVCR